MVGDGGHREGKEPAGGGEEGGTATGAAPTASETAPLDNTLSGSGFTEGDLLVMAASDGGGGDAGVWVEALTYCPHVLSPSTTLLSPDSVPPFDSLCHSCKDGSENWVCLSCGVVGCGRYVGGHMMQHVRESNHPVAAGFRDLSVWCFQCDSYLDAIRIPALEPLFASLHLAKFGQPPAKPSS